MNTLFANTIGLFNIELSFPNVHTHVMDSGECWITMREKYGYKLQMNKITEHYRIINEKKVRMAWGNWEAMNSKFNGLIAPCSECEYGDIVAIRRVGGLYYHFAVYVGNGEVIHYAAENGDWGGKCSIHRAPFGDFLNNDIEFDILSFSENGGAPKHKHVYYKDNETRVYSSSNANALYFLDKAIRKLRGYHIYSPAETVARAESKLGETKYNIAFNNCEHFAIWCKTGVAECSQIVNIINRILPVFCAYNVPIGRMIRIR